jgi:hypothetical protein
VIEEREKSRFLLRVGMTTRKARARARAGARAGAKAKARAKAGAKARAKAAAKELKGLRRELSQAQGAKLGE